jgi:hypothetical protein
MADRTDELLTEIRDLLVTRENAYTQYLADSERLYKDQFAHARRQSMIYRPFQWGALFAVVYYAVVLALRNQ